MPWRGDINPAVILFNFYWEYPAGADLLSVTKKSYLYDCHQIVS
jgi:hypothetical protein